MKTISKFFQKVVRFLAVWFVDTAALLLTAWLIPGISFQSGGEVSVFVVATAAALMLGIINLIVRPAILLVAMPLGWIVVFGLGFLINAITLQITSALMPGFTVNSWLEAFIGGLFLSFVNMILIELLNIDDNESFYANLTLREASKDAVVEKGENRRGLVMLEIDGLSYHHIKKAVDDGFMPTVKSLIDESGYKISRVDCGIPSSTPACQAGILQGNNDNMPAFRWLDKETNRMMAGGPQMAELEPVLSNGKGLLEGGTSISNMFSGDAEKSILTMTKIKADTEEEKKKRAKDMYLLMRNPYFFMRVLALFFVDVVRELWQYWQQSNKDVQPRLNRLHKGYPFLRAATNVFLRDVGAYFTILEIVRGTPAIYTLFAGYDEVAHHSGPWTTDAMQVLNHFDQTVSKILLFVDRNAPRPYEFILLSDHGQSFGATFEQRYGLSITEYVQSLLPEGTQTAETGGGDDGTIGVTAMMNELENMQDENVTGRVGTAVVDRTRRVIKNNLEQQPGIEEVEPANMTLCYSGNLAQVYFDLKPHKLTLKELNEAFPGMVDEIVGHDGVGFVVAYEDNGQPVVFGKNGARNLHTGDILGEDPLEQYGDPELRAWQVRRVVDFPHSGDLTLNSPYYPDGTVAAYEELIGSHGGLGGEQTDAFIFHPGDMEIPPTRNSNEIMSILKSRIGLLGSAPKPEVEEDPREGQWRIPILAAGLGRVSEWLNNAWEAVTLNRDTYREVGKDIYMTGPALLIALISQIIQSFFNEGGLEVLDLFLRLAAWFIAVLLLFLAANIMRGKADYTATMRVAGFAQGAHILELLGFIPVVGDLARLTAVVLTAIGTWIGTSATHELKGWRTVLLPVLFIFTVVVSVVFIESVLEGTALTIERILADFGF
jgi:uncharacterized membrane protein YvlD (DUF360 family)